MGAASMESDINYVKVFTEDPRFGNLAGVILARYYDPMFKIRNRHQHRY